MTLYDKLADLPLRVDDVGYEPREAETASGFTRATTVVSLSGNGAVGRGEDVIYAPEAHESLRADPPAVPTGVEATFDEYHRSLGAVDLFPGDDPDRGTDRNYRRWAFESAALDLALRQRGASLADRVGRAYRPVRFVVSPALGDPPSADRVADWLAVDGSLEFKLDPSDDWSDRLIDRLAATGAVRIVDLKGLYEDEDVALAPDAALYERVLAGFPDALVEDPAVTDDTVAVLEGALDRLSWDYPIDSVASVEARPWPVRWLNVKPSRFGTVRSLLETIEYARDHGVRLYGGGQFELDVGREHLHAIASLFYPAGPNDVAPAAYNAPGIDAGVEPSPLAVPDDPLGLSWA